METPVRCRVQYGTGARVSGVKKNFETGAPNITNNPFDLMIQGDGFFALILPNETIKYTRDGSFNVDRTGTLVSKKGYRVFPTIVFPSGTTNVKISASGIVRLISRTSRAQQPWINPIIYF